MVDLKRPPKDGQNTNVFSSNKVFLSLLNMIIIQDKWEYISKTSLSLPNFVSAIVSLVCLSLTLLLLIPQVSFFVFCISIANVMQKAKSNRTSY
jgi:hypothetical protein